MEKITDGQVKRHLHTTISSNTYELLDKLAEEYGTKQNVIEAALKLLQVRHHILDNVKKSELDQYQLFHLMRTDFNMMAVARRTFLSYIANMPQEPIQNNNAMELIEWYYNNTPAKDLKILQILEAIQALWMAGNYFRKISIQNLDLEESTKISHFKMVFSHDFDDARYGKYWAEYFKYILELEPIKAKISYETRNQSFYLDIHK